MDEENSVPISRTANKFKFRTTGDDEVKPRKGPIPFSEIPIKKVHFLWKPYIPLKKVTLLGGDPKSGKSFITAGIAAALSRGDPLPGEDGPTREPMNVLMVSAEDDPSDTMKPRLLNLGADMRRVFIEREKLVIDEDGLKALAQMIDMTQAKLLIIDPIVAYFGTKMDMNRANDVRPVMQGLANLAEKKNISVLVIRHNRKTAAGATEGKRIFNGFGSIDFTAAVRSELAVEKGKGDRNYFYHITSSTTKEGVGWTYWIETMPDETGMFHWGDMIIPNMNSRTGGISKRFKNEDEVKNWLFDYLKDKPNGDLGKNIFAAGTMKGFSQTKIEHVKKGIAISEKMGKDWVWRLDVTKKDVDGTAE